MTMLFNDLSVVVLDKLLRYVVMVMDERYVLAYSCVRIYMSKGTGLLVDINRRRAR